MDRLEAKIRRIVPGVVHVDLEVDRGKVDKRLQEPELGSKQRGASSMTQNPNTTPEV